MSVMMSDFDLKAAARSIVPVSQFVTFTCSNRSFGVDIMSVREIRSWSPITVLPDRPFAAKGVLDIRGRIVEVYDLPAMLGISPDFGDAQTSQVILVVSLLAQDVGLVVDSVSDIIFAQGDDLRPVPAGNAQQANGAVSALVKNEERLIGILNLGALFPGEAGSDL